MIYTLGHIVGLRSCLIEVLLSHNCLWLVKVMAESEDVQGPFIEACCILKTW